MSNTKVKETIAGAAFIGAVILGLCTHWIVGVAAFFAIVAITESAKKKSKIQYYESKKDIQSISCQVESGEHFNQEVVGESHYMKTLKSAVPSKFRNKERVRLYTIFLLEQEDNNQHDSNAVAVKLNNETIGHLPRTDAKKYREWVKSNGASKFASCRGVIVGNDDFFGVWLDLPDL